MALIPIYSSRATAYATASPSSNAIDSFTRSCRWNWSSGRTSESEMHKNVPDEKIFERTKKALTTVGIAEIGLTGALGYWFFMLRRRKRDEADDAGDAQAKTP